MLAVPLADQACGGFADFLPSWFQVTFAIHFGVLVDLTFADVFAVFFVFYFTSGFFVLRVFFFSLF